MSANSVLIDAVAWMKAWAHDWERMPDWVYEAEQVLAESEDTGGSLVCQHEWAWIQPGVEQCIACGVFQVSSPEMK